MIEAVNLVLILVFAVIYAWVFYSIPILVFGARNVFRRRKAKLKKVVVDWKLPFVSVILPVKDEAAVIGRLFDSLNKLNYPKDRFELVIAEDGSTDDTLEVCKRLAKNYKYSTVVHKVESKGKPSALNNALKHCRDELVAVFDADNIPEPDSFLLAARYFVNPAVAAVQGRNLTINSEENMLTRFTAYEEAVWCDAYLGGKQQLGLFVHLKGTCEFIRREVLVGLGGFNERFLSDDMEISARLLENNQEIKYASEVRSWQESPSSIVTHLSQRTRWFRGTMEVAFKYGRLLKTPNRKNLDAEITLYGPFILIASLLSYLVGSGAFFATYPYTVVWNVFTVFSLFAMTFVLVFCGVSLVFITRPIRLRNLFWLPFVFGYWCVQSFIAIYAALLIAFRRPGRWVKTEKSGKTASLAFEHAIEG
jgi:cellulose synthase/poly-beta-1,6-N-acetylglucosamine synthase-like glycosyltransferase